MEGSQIPDFLDKWKNREEGENCWTVQLEDIVERGYDLSAKNPNRQDDYEHRPALELVQSIKAKEERIMDLLSELEDILNGNQIDRLLDSKTYRCSPPNGRRNTSRKPAILGRFADGSQLLITRIS